MIKSASKKLYSTWGMCPLEILYPSCTSILATKGFRITVNQLSSLTKKAKTKHQENLAVMVKLKKKKKKKHPL